MKSNLFTDIVVNGQRLPHTVVAAEAQNHTAPRSKPALAWSKAANAIALRTLLLQEAERQNIEPQPEKLGPGRFETREEALIRGLLNTAINIELPEEEAIRAEWQRNPSRFRAPPLFEVSHILIACDPQDEQATKKARHKAEKLLEMVQTNSRDFAKIASQHSQCGSRSSGGALGQLGPGDSVPEFEKVLHQLNDQEITQQPVLTRHGWHIIRMDARADGSVLPYENVRPKISDAMQKLAWAKAAKTFISDLVEKSEISGADLKPII